MLELDADKRITADQTLAHPYLAQVTSPMGFSVIKIETKMVVATAPINFIHVLKYSFHFT